MGCSKAIAGLVADVPEFWIFAELSQLQLEHCVFRISASWGATAATSVLPSQPAPVWVVVRCLLLRVLEVLPTSHALDGLLMWHMHLMAFCAPLISESLSIQSVQQLFDGDQHVL